MGIEEEIVINIKLEMEKVKGLDVDKRINIINKINSLINTYSPHKNEPVNNVIWVKDEDVVANDYNPNRVAPPEMKLLECSIREDGFTQPIVVYEENDDSDHRYTVIDGFHRNRVGKEIKDINKRTIGYLPVVVINKPLSERIASTIRHNRARGTHAIQPMSKIVEELYFMGWSDKKIAEQLGMDKDEVLRLKQFTGLGNLFKNRDFSKSWVGVRDEE